MLSVGKLTARRKKYSPPGDPPFFSCWEFPPPKVVDYSPGRIKLGYSSDAVITERGATSFARVRLEVVYSDQEVCGPPGVLSPQSRAQKDRAV